MTVLGFLDKAVEIASKNQNEFVSVTVEATRHSDGEIKISYTCFTKKDGRLVSTTGEHHNPESALSNLASFFPQNQQQEDVEI